MSEAGENLTPTSSRWMLDKRIPVAALIGVAMAIFANFGGLVWLASSWGSRLDTVETRTADIDTRTADTKLFTYRLEKVEQSTARIEVKLDAAINGKGDH